VGRGGAVINGRNFNTTTTGTFEVQGSGEFELQGQESESIVVPGTGEVPRIPIMHEVGVEVDTSLGGDGQSESQVSGPNDGRNISINNERVPTDIPINLSPRPERKPIDNGGNRGQGGRSTIPERGHGQANEVRPGFGFGDRSSPDPCNCFRTQRCPSQVFLERQIASYNAPCRACISQICGKLNFG